MPRKRRNRPRDSEDEACAVPRKRRHTENTEEMLVISDSDNEEEEFKPTKKEVRLLERENKAITQGLTEEEMVSLAMKLSAEEATNAARRQKEEDEEVNRAIAESLQANDSQAESVSLVMTQDTSSSLDEASPAASGSPVFPPRQQHSCLNSSEGGTDASACNDNFLGMDTITTQPLMPDTQGSELQASLGQSPASEKKTFYDTHCTSQIPQGPSTFSLPSGKDSVKCGSRSPVRSAVLCIQRLSQDLVEDCQASGFIRCSQELPVLLAPSGSSELSLRANPVQRGSSVMSRLDLENVEEAGTSGTATSSVKGVVARPSGDEEDAERSPCSQGLFVESCDSSQSLLSSRKTRRFSLRRATVGHTTEERDLLTQGNASIDMDEEEFCKRKSVLGKVSFHKVANENEFPTQMDLHWSQDDEEEEEEDRGSQKKHKCGENVRSVQEPHDAVCDTSEEEDVVPSPTFPRRAKSPMQTPQRSAAERGGFVGSPGVRFPAPRAQRRLPLESMKAANANAVPGKEEVTSRVDSVEKVGPHKPVLGSGAVHYYWGVPFCPRGQNPDVYTQVILSQLEVYEKSLKRAQRGLLRKAEWGSPVLPAPPERMKRTRAPRLLDEEEEDDREEEEGKAEEEEEDMVEVNERTNFPRGAEVAERKGEKTEDWGGTGGEKSPEHFIPEEIPEKRKSLRKQSLRKSRPAEAETQCAQQEVGRQASALYPEIQVCSQHLVDLERGSPASSKAHSAESDCEIVMLDEDVSAPAGEAEAQAEVEDEETGQMEMAPCSESGSAWVECPICMRRFAPERIEIHAAYCDGAAEDQLSEEPLSQLTSRRKSSRRFEATEDTQPSSSSVNIVQQTEKCYVCQGVVRMKDYERHVDECIHKRSARSSKGKALLLALDQLEQSVDVDVSEAGSTLDSTRKRGYSSAALWDDESKRQDSPSAKQERSVSPIRSFTSISKATDCLVDLKQYPAKPGQRGRRKKFK